MNIEGHFDYKGGAVLQQSEGIKLVNARQEAMAELDKLLGDSAFLASGRNKKFLRYIMTETLEGRGDSIKAYSIAIDVFGRPPTFNPAADSVVRLEATRLRAALDIYYDKNQDRLRIEIPKGRYVPWLRRAVRTSPLEPGQDLAEDTVSPQQGLPKKSGKGLFGGRGVVNGSSIALLLLIPIGLVLFGLSTRQSVAPAYSEKPTVSVQIDATDGAGKKVRDKIRDELVAALSRFSTVRIADSMNVLKLASFSRGSGSDAISRTYQVMLRTERNAGQLEVAWRVLDERMQLVRAGKQIAGTNAKDPSIDPGRLVSTIAKDIAGYGGAVPSTETRLEFDNPTLGNGCVQRVFVSLGERLEEEIANGRQCLEETLASHPGDADARAMFALLILTAKPFATTPEETAQAVELARTAVSLAPDSQRSAFALMVALYHSREIEAAIAAGERAVLLNPHDSGPQIYLSWILYVSGHWGKGVKLLQESQNKNPLFSNFDAGATVALDIYRQGDYDKAISLLSQKPYRRAYLAALIRIAAFGQLGRKQEAAAAIEDLRKSRPWFDETFSTDMAARSLVPELVDGLKTGLLKTGLSVR